MSQEEVGTLGDLVLLLYERYLEIYGEGELARLAASTVANEMLLNGFFESASRDEAA